jgi:hypothetical protein
MSRCRLCLPGPGGSCSTAVWHQPEVRLCRNQLSLNDCFLYRAVLWRIGIPRLSLVNKPREHVDEMKTFNTYIGSSDRVAIDHSLASYPAQRLSLLPAFYRFCEGLRNTAYVTMLLPKLRLELWACHCQCQPETTHLDS